MNPHHDSSYDSVSNIGELYDLASPYGQRGDVQFYVDEALKSAGKVLEIGCGTGRVLLPIARRGISIVGIDRSPAMLERCYEMLALEDENVRRCVRLEQMDMRNFDLRDRFSLAIIPFRPFQHLLTVTDQLNTLRSIHRHMLRGGHLVFDVFNTDFKRIVAGPTGEQEDHPPTAMPDGRTARRTGKVSRVNATMQINDIELIYHVTDKDGNTEQMTMAFPMRWFGRFEIEHLLERCGFGLKTVYGNFDQSDLVDGSPEMIFVAERR